MSGTSPYLVTPAVGWCDRVVAYNVEGAEQWNKTISVNSLRVCDIDHDGIDEVLVGTRDGQLQMIQADGVMGWTFKTDTGWVWSAVPLPGNDSGESVALLCGSSRLVTVLDRQGKEIRKMDFGQAWTKLVSVDSPAHSPPSYVAAAGGSRVIVAKFSRDGSEQWKITEKSVHGFVDDIAVNAESELVAVAIRDVGVIIHSLKDGAAVAQMLTGRRNHFITWTNKDGENPILVYADTHAITAYGVSQRE
jgi:hypothetical protein